jgi:hypothetical protein
VGLLISERRNRCENDGARGSFHARAGPDNAVGTRDATFLLVSYRLADEDVHRHGHEDEAEVTDRPVEGLHCH